MDIIVFAETKEEMEQAGDLVYKGCTECGTGINDKTAVRLFGTRAQGPGAVRIGPVVCKTLKDPKVFGDYTHE